MNAVSPAGYPLVACDEDNPKLWFVSGKFFQFKLTWTS